MSTIKPEDLAADGDLVDPGIEPPSEEEQLQYLVDNGWPAGEQES
jgi:hypothetical protein